MSSAEEAVRSIADGIADIKKDRGKIANYEVLGRYRFGKEDGPMVMRVGGSPDLLFNKTAPSSVVDDKVTYRVRMAIADAEFQNSGNKKVCVESASFFSEVTAGAEFALTYEIMDYCFSAVDRENKCIPFPPKSKVRFIFPYFNKCDEIPQTKPEEQAKCMCKAISLKGSIKKLTRNTAQYVSSSSSSTSSAPCLPALTSPSTTDSSAVLTNIPILFMLLCLFLSRYH